MKDHKVAAGAWLLLVVGLIGFGAKAGIESGLKEGRHRAIVEAISGAIELARGGQLSVAEQKLSALASEYPEDASIWLNLGISQLAQKKLDAADESFARVLEIDPKDFDAVAERAGIQKQRGNVDAALALLETIPAGEGRMAKRLVEDPLWRDIKTHDRIRALWKKHNADRRRGDHSLRVTKQLEAAARQHAKEEAAEH